MSDKKPAPPQPPKQLPPWALTAVSVGLLVVSLLTFALFDHVIPHYDVEAVYVPPTAEDVYDTPTTQNVPEDEAPTEQEEAVLIDEAEDAPGSKAAEAPEKHHAIGDFSDKFADKFTDGEVISTNNTYQSANLNVTLTRKKGKIGEYEQVVFIADIYIRNIDCLRTVLAKDSFGRSLTEDAVKMSKRANAVCAINADFYSFGNAGIVIRNGVLYREKYQTGEDVLIIFRDGTMRVYSKASQIDMDRLMEEGAWQGFSFGPSLLDAEGELRKSYKRAIHDPRTLIGMIEPGHYVFIVVDGRQNGYSEGMNYYECAQLAKNLGCKVAFNLDGGKTSQILFGNKVVNKPYKGGRDTSDLICIVDITR